MTVPPIPAGPPALTGPPTLAGLQRLTAARIGLDRAGGSLATAPLMAFRLAQARARDAVHAPLDMAALATGLAALPGEAPPLPVSSPVPDRRAYLMRPDLGRVLDDASATVLEATAAARSGPHDLVVVVADGLSAQAAQRHAVPLLAALLPALRAGGWRIAPLVLAQGARVRLGDAVARALGAAAVLMLVGERPGLSAPDSLGAYLTWNPHPGTTDADRNCVSNIRPEGLALHDAAYRIDHLLEQMRRLGRSGVSVKDSSGQAPRLEAPPL